MTATEWNFDSSPMPGDRLFHFRQCIRSQQNLSFRAFKLHIREKHLTQNSSITFFRMKKRPQVNCPVNYTCRQWSPETEREPRRTEKNRYWGSRKETWREWVKKCKPLLSWSLEIPFLDWEKLSGIKFGSWKPNDRRKNLYRGHSYSNHGRKYNTSFRLSFEIYSGVRWIQQSGILYCEIWKSMLHNRWFSFWKIEWAVKNCL